MLRHKGTVPLPTERLLLRRFALEDADAMYENWAKDAAVSRFLTWESHRSTEDSKAFLRSLDYSRPQTYEWAITYGGTPIGSISVVSIDENSHIAALGYCIGRAFWNQGITSEAVRAVIAFLFDEVGVHRVEIDHAEKNPASGAVAKKCGFTYEGKSRAKFYRHGEYLDICHWAVLAEDRKR